MAVVQNYLPGDPLLIDKIVYELKSQGIFDQFRKECIADVDTKPAYQNLRQRVEGSVNGFLNKQKWSPDMNKNQLREMLRKNIQESGFLETGVERIVDQVVNPKINSVFLPKVTEVVYKFLGIESKASEAVSPESEKKLDISNDSQNLDDSKIDEDESPPFEPLEEKPVYTMATEENSMDSHLSGFSGLMSHDSNHSQELSKTTQVEVSNQDSTLSKQSSEGRLSIVMSDDNDTKMEVCEDFPQQKQSKANENKQKSFNFQSEIANSNSSKRPDSKIDEKSSKSSSKREYKHKSRHDSRSEKDGKRDEKGKRSDKERKEHKDKEKHNSRDKTKDKERKESKSGRSESSKRESDKDIKSEKTKSSSRHGSSSKEKSNSSKKETSSKDRGDNKERDRSKSMSSSSSKDKESKHKDDKSKHSSSKHESRSDKHKKDDKHHKSDKHSSSNSKNREKDKKDPKKDKKENKDDHFSSKKRSDRRSTDRDSNDGQSGLKSSSSSFDSYSSSQTQSKGQESSNSNSNSNNGSGDSNSDAVEGTTTSNTDTNSVKEHLDNLPIAPVKLFKPKFASNIHEAKKLMKIRKRLALLEKHNLLTEAKAISQKIIENNKQKSMTSGHKNNNKVNNSNAIKKETPSRPISPVPQKKEPTPEPLSPPLKSSVVSAATWDALEAKLHESINYTTSYEELDGPDDVVMQEPEVVTRNKDDCRYLDPDAQSGKVQRYQQFTSEYIANLESSIKANVAKETEDKERPRGKIRKNHVNNVVKGAKRKFADYNSDIKNNNSNKKFNTHHIEVHDNFSLPLSPAESDNSIDKKSDTSDSSEKAIKKTEGEFVKKTNRASSNNQRYSSEDLYKPRHMFGGSRRRNARNLALD
ncbi:hypothetical protein Trydic_g17391 [Trypoxylus dichotomus]